MACLTCVCVSIYKLEPSDTLDSCIYSCSERAFHDRKWWKCLRAMQADYVRLDQDILTPLAGKKKLYTFETNDFWEQIKTPGWVISFLLKLGLAVLPADS